MNWRPQGIIAGMILLSALLMCSHRTVSAQSSFSRNDAFDFRGRHALTITGSSINSVNVGLATAIDWRYFKIAVHRGNDFPNFWFVHGVELDWTGDGTWDVETFDNVILSHLYSEPPNGVSDSYQLGVRIQFRSTLGGQTPPEFRTMQVPITVLASPRVYATPDGDALVQLHNADCTTKIPLLMVEGIDATNATSADVYYYLSQELIEPLYSQGYEVFFLNFQNATRDMRLNAAVVREALDKVHELCPSSQIVLAGMSMGGVVARYALAQAEDEGAAHHVGMFLSYDSPQQRAHANAGLQDYIKEQPSSITAVSALQGMLQSTAAQQMLGYNTYDADGSEHDGFYNELRALNGDGYPNDSYNVAISNGTRSATWGYDHEGRHLLTLKIHDDNGGFLIDAVTAGQQDCRPGSTQIDLVQAHYGLIYANPWLRFVGAPDDAWYEVAIEFNPVYMPTTSALDLQEPYFFDSEGNLLSDAGSKFDDTFVQPVPPERPRALGHNAVSAATITKVLEWLDRTANLVVNYSAPEGGSISPQTFQVPILGTAPVTIPPKTVTVNGRQVTYYFRHWDDGSTQNPRSFYAKHYGAARTVTMKAHLATSASGADWASSERRIAEGVDVGGPTYHAVYESGGAVWHVRNRRNAGWEAEHPLSPVGYGARTNATVTTQSFSLQHSDLIQVHVAWIETDEPIWYRASNVDNGVTWMPTVGHTDFANPTSLVLPDPECSAPGAPSECWPSLIYADTGPEGQPTSGGIFYVRQARLATGGRLVPGTAGASSQVAAVNSGDCGFGFQLAFIRDGKVHFMSFRDPMPNPYFPAEDPVSCGSPIDLTTPGWTATNPSMVRSASALHVAWEESNGTDRRIVFRQRTGAMWSSRVYLTHAGHVTSKPVLGIDHACGKLNLLWQCGSHVARATRAVSAGAWDIVEDLGSGRAPAIVASGVQKAVPMWTSEATAPYAINFAHALACASWDNGCPSCEEEYKAEEIATPVQFTLSQNHPNPFERRTTIQFELPVTTTVTLEVFDLQGRKVATVANGRYPAGYHAAEWDRRSTSGEAVRSGAYVYRITAGSFRAQRKMVLLP